MEAHDVTTRPATPEEARGLTGWYKWAYEHGVPLAFWPEDNTITTVPDSSTLVSNYIVLRK